MATDLKLLPRAERLLSGTISGSMDETQTTVDVSNPPSVAELPTYWEIEPDSTTKKELVRIVGVSSDTITLERGLNNGGTGFTHVSLSPYKGKITSLHWKKVVDSIESGYLSEDISYAFAKVTTASFKVTASGVDRTPIYTAGRKVRLNGTVIARIESSSYSNPDTTVVIDDTTVPVTITSIEVEIATKGDTDFMSEIVPELKATGAVVNTGTSDITIVTPKSLADSDYVKATGSPSENDEIRQGSSGPEWYTPSGAASFWTSFAGAYATGVTMTVATDLTAIFKKGVTIKWLSSADALKIGKVVSSSYGAPNTTITVVGSTVASGDKSFYYGSDVMSETFIIPGNQATGTNVSKTWTAKTDIYPISVDAFVGTAGTTNSTDYDVNDDASTIISTKPSISSGGTSDIDNVVTAPTTSIAVNSLITVDIDAASTTQAIDGYITLFYIPIWWISRT